MHPYLYPRKYRTLTRWVTVVSFWIIMLSISMGKWGVTHYFKLRDVKNELILSNSKIRSKNQQIRNEVSVLTHSKLAQEDYIRQDFGYIKEGEIVYRFETIPKERDFRKKSDDTMETLISNNSKTKKRY